jgi:signal transduction histidine kinase
VSGTERAAPWLVAGFGLLVALLAAGVVQALASARGPCGGHRRRDDRGPRRSNQELERFAFVGSHDLQQPLRTISGFLQLLEHQAGDRLDAQSREYVGYALRGSEHMSRLIDDLLTYSAVAADDGR